MAAPVFFGPGCRLADPADRRTVLRRPATSFYIGPQVVNGPGDVLGGTLIQYVQPPRQARKTMSRLGKPIASVPGVLARPIKVKLAPSHRGRTRSFWTGPAVLPPAAPAYGGIGIQLAPSHGPKRTHSKLGAPVVVSSGALARPIDATLVRIRPQRTHPHLSLPAVVAPGIAFGGPRVRLVNPRATRPPVHSRLAPPAVIAYLQLGRIETTLARIRPQRTHSHLFPPAVVAPGIAFGGPRVRLVNPRSTRPAVIHHLFPPTSTTPSEIYYASKPHLARIRPPRTHWRLQPPTVVFPFFARPTEVTLVRIRPPRTRWLLRAPVVVFPFIARPTEITLAPQRRGRPIHKLFPPTVIAPPANIAYAPVAVHLTYSRRGRPIHKLSPPTVVSPVLARPIKVTLAPSRRLKAMWLLAPPAVVGAPFVSRSIHTHLARIRPVRTHWLLRPPTVVDFPHAFAPIATNLVRIRPQRTHYRLQPPTVVGIAHTYAPITTHLVRIRPVRTHWLLRPPTVLIEVCYGDVCGYDYGPWACGTDSAAATTSGSDSAASVTGSDSAARVDGTTAPGGSVCGGDARREGC